VKQISDSDSRAEAAAYLEQAHDFYRAAVSAAISAARPLLLYYCFLNLAKALILQRALRPSLPNAAHGLKERLKAGNRELQDAYLITQKSPGPGGNLQVFDEFLSAIRTTGLSADQNFDLLQLIPQVVPGHRLWAQGAGEDERFIAVNDITMMHSKTRKELWLNLYLVEDDLTRFGITHKDLLDRSRLKGTFRQVTTKKTSNDGRKLVRLEQIAVTTYDHRPSDELQSAVAAMRGHVWATVASVPPYRRYYLYLAPVAEHAAVLPQLLSIYAITFYLGSITRYRPHHFDSILSGPFGPRVEEFISGQPLQFIYLMASEFAKQEVTKPSIV